MHSDILFHKQIRFKTSLKLMKQFLRDHDTDKAHEKPLFVIPFQDNIPPCKLEFSREKSSCILY